MRDVRKPILAVLTCAALVFSAASAAQAAPRADRTVASSLTTDTSAAARQRIVDAWTPERRRNARAAVLAEDSSGADTEALRSQASAVASPAGIVQLPESPIVGKLFYVDGVTGEDEWCSGTVVDAPSQSLIFTAGHCLKSDNYGAAGVWSTDLVFFPEFPYGAGEDGFAWYHMSVMPRWGKFSDYSKDVGTVTVAKRDGLTLEAFTGNGATVVWNQGIDTQRTVIIQGYPVNSAAGTYQVSCQATTENAAPQWTDRVGIAAPGCWLNSGSSGAGFILNWGTGSQQLTGVQSALDIADGDNFSPYFDNNVQILYTNASTVMPPP